MRPATAQPNGKVPRACRAFPATERRRGRIYPAWGYQTSPVLKTEWATRRLPPRLSGATRGQVLVK